MYMAIFLSVTIMWFNDVATTSLSTLMLDRKMKITKKKGMRMHEQPMQIIVV